MMSDAYDSPPPRTSGTATSGRVRAPPPLGGVHVCPGEITHPPPLPSGTLQAIQELRALATPPTPSTHPSPSPHPPLLHPQMALGQRLLTQTVDEGSRRCFRVCGSGFMADGSGFVEYPNPSPRAAGPAAPRADRRRGIREDAEAPPGPLGAHGPPISRALFQAPLGPTPPLTKP